ncbi:MAG: HXXEE domain-containing protein [Bacillota bacterium]
MINYLNTIDFNYIIWLIPAVLLLHELEEWNILKWYEANYTDIPPSTDRSIRVWLIAFSIFGFLWTFISYIMPIRGIAAALMTVLVMLTIQNGLQHLYWQLLFMKYAPGIVFSVFFGLPAGAYVLYRVISEGLLPKWLILLIMALMLPGLLETVKAGNRMTRIVRAGHETGLWLDNIIFNRVKRRS